MALLLNAISRKAIDVVLVAFRPHIFSVQARSQFARIHTSSLINIENILNRPITKFYNGNDVNVIASELRLIKARLTSFYKKYNLL